MADGSDIALVELELGGEPEAWEHIGFRVQDGAIALGATRLRPAGGGGGVRGWTLAGVAGAAFDGLPTTVVSEFSRPAVVDHPNGVTRIDHFVARTPRFDVTVAALEAGGLSLRRVREATPDVRQGFFWVGDTILELVEDSRVDSPEFWGVTVVSPDLDATAAFLGPRLGDVRPAVQRGRRIATVAREAGHRVPLAIMSPHVKKVAA